MSAYTIETDGVREIVLTKPTDMPIYVQKADGTVGTLLDSFTILNANEMVSISGRYLEAKQEPTSSRAARFWRRFWI